MSELPFNVLISSAGRRVALMRTFRQALANLGLQGRLVATDMSPYASAFQMADLRFNVPRCTDDEFIPFMLELCEREEIRLIIPTIDTELSVYAAYRGHFQDIGTVVAVSSPFAVAVGGDKLATHQWLTDEGLPTVEQASAKDFLADPSGWEFPVIAKPVHGSSSIGVVVAHSVEDVAAAASDKPYVVQSIAPGVEFTVSVLANREGKALCAVPRQRLEVRAGEVSKARAVRNKAVQDLAMEVVERLPGAYGALNVQLFWDEATDALNIIEINARFGGGFPLAWQVGARYPQWLIEEILGLPSTVERDSWDNGIVMLRYDDAVFVDGRGLPPR